jgi:hypothetical protein
MGDDVGRPPPGSGPAAAEKELAKIDSTPDRNRVEPRSFPSLAPSDVDIAASVVGSVVVGESPEVNIVVDGVGVVAASASVVVASVSAGGTAGIVVAFASANVARPCTLAVGKAVAVGLRVVIAVVVASRLDIVVAVSPFAVVGIAQM